ncbi:MAG: tetratricopeptide repeat protein [Acidobacteriia bacterium]|nr:tetratricopeptide repeat protein [Terriglobia bacterium]
MPRTGLLLALFVLTACGTCLPQGGVRLTPSRPTRLRVIVTYDDGLTRVRDVTVELQDGVGGTSAMASQTTGTDGQAEFNTMTGMHRVRIYGADVQPYEAEFEITPVESFHREDFRVKRKLEGNAAPPQGGPGFVPTVRLKIPDNARKQFEKGSGALADKQWDSARKSFQSAIDLYPDYDLAYNGLGIANTQMLELTAARKAFQKAIALNDKFAGAQRNLARIMLSERNYQETTVLLNQSLAVEPTDAWALTNAAYAELQLHRFKEAADHATRVHALPHQGLANAHVIAAYALDALGQHQEAVAQWKQYLEEDPKGLNVKRAQEEVRRLTKSPQS